MSQAHAREPDTVAWNPLSSVTFYQLIVIFLKIINFSPACVCNIWLDEIPERVIRSRLGSAVMPSPRAPRITSYVLS